MFFQHNIYTTSIQNWCSPRECLHLHSSTFTPQTYIHNYCNIHAAKAHTQPYLYIIHTWTKKQFHTQLRQNSNYLFIPGYTYCNTRLNLQISNTTLDMYTQHKIFGVH